MPATGHRRHGRRLSLRDGVIDGFRARSPRRDEHAGPRCLPDIVRIGSTPCRCSRTVQLDAEHRRKVMLSTLGSMPTACTTMSKGMVIGRLTSVSSPLTISRLPSEVTSAMRALMYLTLLFLALPVILALLEAEGADIHVVDVDVESWASPRGFPWRCSPRPCSRSWSTIRARSAGRATRRKAGSPPARAPARRTGIGCRGRTKSSARPASWSPRPDRCRKPHSGLFRLSKWVNPVRRMAGRRRRCVPFFSVARKVAGSPAKALHGRVQVHADRGAVLLHAGRPCRRWRPWPIRGGHQPAYPDRIGAPPSRSAFSTSDRPAARGCQGMGGRQPRRAATDNQDGFVSLSRSLQGSWGFTYPGPDVMARLGSYSVSIRPALTSSR